MYGCESWTIEKAECQRMDAFELWCWRRLLRVPWTARRSNQSILKEISPGCSLKGMMLKLKLQYFGHLMWRIAHWKRPWCWERLKGRGEGADRGWSGWMTSLMQWTWVWASSGSWWWTGKPSVLQSMWSHEFDTAERLNWIEILQTQQSTLGIVRESQNFYLCLISKLTSFSINKSMLAIYIFSVWGVLISKRWLFCKLFLDILKF